MQQHFWQIFGSFIRPTTKHSREKKKKRASFLTISSAPKRTAAPSSQCLAKGPVEMAGASWPLCGSTAHGTIEPSPIIIIVQSTRVANRSSSYPRFSKAPGWCSLGWPVSVDSLHFAADKSDKKPDDPRSRRTSNLQSPAHPPIPHRSTIRSRAKSKLRRFSSVFGLDNLRIKSPSPKAKLNMNMPPSCRKRWSLRMLPSATR